MLNPLQFSWMMFRPEGNDVVYLWDGEWAIPIHVPSHEGKQSDWYWNGTVPQEISAKEKGLINDVMNSRKKVFQVPRKDKRRYTVISRGVYEYTNK